MWRPCNNPVSCCPARGSKTLGPRAFHRAQECPRMGVSTGGKGFDKGGYVC